MPDQTTPSAADALWTRAKNLWKSGGREEAEIIIRGLLADQTEPPPQSGPTPSGDAPGSSAGDNVARTLGIAGVLLAIGALTWIWLALRPAGEGETPGGDWRYSNHAIRVSPPLAASQPILRPEGTPFIAFGNTRLMHVLHAESPPKLDGALNPEEWNRAASFRGALPAPYADRYYINGYLKCDDEFFYIAAHVGDPLPLRNSIDPSATPADVYKGGLVSVHLSSVEDPTKDSNTRRIDIWAFGNDSSGEPNARLAIYKGTSGTNPEAPPKFNEEGGSSGKLKRDADNLGYSLEYQIQWRDLWESDPPADGTERAVCWDVRWSDPAGKTFLAKLSDLLNPETAQKLDPVTFHSYEHPDDGPVLSYEHPELWGRAVFHRK